MKALRTFVLALLGMSCNVLAEGADKNGGAADPSSRAPSVSGHESASLSSDDSVPEKSDASNSLADSEEWSFFPRAIESLLSFETIVSKDVFILPKESLRGRFSIRLTGDTPTRPLIRDRKLAAELNSFTLQLDGYIKDTVLIGADSPVAVLGGVKGLLRMTNKEESWDLPITQENFSIMGATLQIDRSRKRVRAYLPARLYHEASGSELHAQLYIMFTLSDDASLVPEQGKFAIRRTPDEHVGLGFSTRLVELLSSRPRHESARQQRLMSRPDAHSVRLTSLKNRNGLGGLSNWPLIESTFCTENAVLVACTDDAANDRSVRMLLSGMPVGRNGENVGSQDWSATLNLYPGASVRNPDGTIINYIEQFSGTLLVGSQAFEVTHANIADQLPTSRYQQSTGTITLTLPASISKKSTPQARVMITATCLATGASSRCTSATLSDATDIVGEVVGDKSVKDLGSLYSSDSLSSRSLEPLPTPNAISAGCKLYCPTCIGVAQDCPGGSSGGFICGDVSDTRCPPSNAKTCC